MQPDDLKQARAKALDLLARREHAAAELRRKLERKGIDPLCAEQAVAELGEEGLQSDTRYAESVVSARVISASDRTATTGSTSTNVPVTRFN